MNSFMEIGPHVFQKSGRQTDRCDSMETYIMGSHWHANLEVGVADHPACFEAVRRCLRFYVAVLSDPSLPKIYDDWKNPPKLAHRVLKYNSPALNGLFLWMTVNSAHDQLVTCYDLTF